MAGIRPRYPRSDVEVLQRQRFSDVAGERRVGQASEHRSPTFDERQKLVWSKAFGSTFAFRQGMVGGVETLPDLAGRHFAGRLGVFARRCDRVDDRAAALVVVAV